MGDVWDSSTVFPVLRDPEHRDPQGQWYAQFLQYSSAAINTELVKPEDAPKTFEDLLDPKWKGRIGWTNNPGVNGPIGFIGKKSGPAQKRVAETGLP